MLLWVVKESHRMRFRVLASESGVTSSHCQPYTKDLNPKPQPPSRVSLPPAPTVPDFNFALEVILSEPDDVQWLSYLK